MTSIGDRRLLCALLSTLALSCARTSDSPAQAPPPAVRNLVLITIDTLRADRVGSYGYAQARTPALDALAARGTRKRGVGTP